LRAKLGLLHISENAFVGLRLNCRANSWHLRPSAFGSSRSESEPAHRDYGRRDPNPTARISTGRLRNRFRPHRPWPCPRVPPMLPTPTQIRVPASPLGASAADFDGIPRNGIPTPLRAFPLRLQSKRLRTEYAALSYGRASTTDRFLPGGHVVSKLSISSERLADVRLVMRSPVDTTPTKVPSEEFRLCGWDVEGCH
jgi:hypothetical protein